MKEKIIYFVVGIILTCIVFLFTRSCRKETTEVYKTKIDTFIVIKTDTIKGSNIITIRNKIVYDTIKIPKVIDTSYAIKDYYTSKKFYQWYNDSVLNLKIVDSIYMNTLFTQTLSYEVFRKTITQDIITLKYITPNELYLNMDVAIGLKSSFIPKIVYLKGKIFYDVGYDIFNKNVIIGVGYKIK